MISRIAAAAKTSISILGRKNYFLLSVFLFTVFSAACGFAPTFGLLVLFRVAQGLAGGGLQPTYAERVRTLVTWLRSRRSRRCLASAPDTRFGSLMPYALDPERRPLFLISNMAMHTQNLKAEPQASLFVGQIAEGAPLGAARATVVGDVEAVSESEISSVRELYLARHDNSRSWVDFDDFSFYRLQPLDIYYVGGFGVMGWVSADDYRQAKPDPPVEAAPGILAHMNADHVARWFFWARTHAGYEATEAAMTSVDRLGFFLRLRTAEGMKGVRINFLREVANAQDTRKVLVEMLRTAEAGTWGA